MRRAIIFFHDRWTNIEHAFPSAPLEICLYNIPLQGQIHVGHMSSFCREVLKTVLVFPSTCEHTKLPYTESNHLSIKVSVIYSDWQWLSRAFHITYCLIILTGDVWD